MFSYVQPPVMMLGAAMSKNSDSTLRPSNSTPNAIALVCVQVVIISSVVPVMPSLDEHESGGAILPIASSTVLLCCSNIS